MDAVVEEVCVNYNFILRLYLHVLLYLCVCALQLTLQAVHNSSKK